MALSHPVILCGGAGTRLWPASRKAYPKQFAKLMGDHSLFQMTLRRFTGPDFAAPLVMTENDFRFMATEQCAQMGLADARVIVEPARRDTAPAILAAALYLERHDPDAVMLVAPSDHVVPDIAGFREAVDEGLRIVREKGHLVTFGITPDRPETGYGYLELSEAPNGSGTGIPLTRFVEKPDAEAAAHMLAAGNFLWNAGLFLARADVLEAVAGGGLFAQQMDVADEASVVTGTAAAVAARGPIQICVANAGIAEGKTLIGYEISFNKYFYQHKPLRSLEEVTTDILQREKENEGLIMEILNA